MGEYHCSWMILAGKMLKEKSYRTNLEIRRAQYLDVEVIGVIRPYDITLHYEF